MTGGAAGSSPFVGLPDRQFWKHDPGIADHRLFDPVSDIPFTITTTDRVVTAGSCFAQHVGRRLAAAGFQHYIAEPAHPVVPETVATRFNYGQFSCRYGNIYTARQLLQLLRRAYGEFVPVVRSWPVAPGRGRRVVDPFRPRIQPDGFSSTAELLADRDHHFHRVRRAIETMDVFVFTLGLTEAWEDRRDGAIHPLAPGVAGGVFDPETVGFRNFDEAETADDLIAALAFIRARNPGVRIVLTVSPVPLNATYEDRHVFVSTTWSKAALRIAAERARRSFDGCAYFPSYEIITAPHVRGLYYDETCREVTAGGVDHVMGLFLRHFAGVAQSTLTEEQAPAAADPTVLAAAQQAERERVFEVLCDEQLITNRARDVNEGP
jgi:hypothetical protein